MVRFFTKYLLFFFLLAIIARNNKIFATEFSNQTFLIAEGKNNNINSSGLWQFLETNHNTGINIQIIENNNTIFIKNSKLELLTLLNRIQELVIRNDSKIIPVFLKFDGNITVLDSIINSSNISSKLFFLPQGETWPSVEYLLQSNRRIILFVDGYFKNESRVLHKLSNYIFSISTNNVSKDAAIYRTESAVNRELFMIDNFEKLPTSSIRSVNNNLIPDYINYLLENWTKYGKRPNFIFTGTEYSSFDFIPSQLNSFTWINGTVKVSGKTLEKVYWKNQDISITGGKFCFPYRGGEELMLSAYAPGYEMTPEQIIITGEMVVSENYSIIATPIELGNKNTGSFSFENVILNTVTPDIIYNGENYTFSQDIERGNVVRLPENASINLGNPEQYGLRNSSFTVSCFVKFTEILEFGDNAVLGNFENEYRRGLHLVLRSGHPYFGLWSNDYISEEKLLPNIWYHLVWRYIIETGEQAIFLNGNNIGSSQGHPPFSGTGDIQLGSALSKGASLRGYVDDLYFWNRPLGKEEINRLALNEEIKPIIPVKEKTFIIKNRVKLFFVFSIILIVIIISVFLRRKIKNKGTKLLIDLPDLNSPNQIQLFSEFKAINNNEENITKQFTPKVKELLLFVLIYTIKNGNGALIADINKQLWSGIETRKIANNRAVTLNKLRKILNEIDGIEIVIENKYLLVKMEKPFFSDYVEAFKLCQTPGGMGRTQLETFFMLVKKGRFLKGISFDWLDDVRGFTGNQVIDNLLNLASIYRKENKLEQINSISKRILDYDELNEEAIFLQIWVLQKTNNSHLAKFNFKSFCQKYEESMGEEFQMKFNQFINFYSKII